MKMKLIAFAALALMAGSALASGGSGGDEQLAVTANININNTVDARTCLFFWGFNWVDGESKASIGNEQYTASNTIDPYYFYDPHATVGGNALKNAQGNIGVNVVAGVGNNQSNDVALSSIDSSQVFAAATSVSHQNSSSNSEYYSWNFATLDGNALAHAKGNVGVNIAAGVGNNQENGLAASSNKSGVLAMATSTNDQTSTGNREHGVYDHASLGGNALMGAQGNIGVNLAAGVGNNQHNSLAIAVATTLK